MKRVLASAAVAAFLLSGCSNSFRAEGSSVPTQAHPSSAAAYAAAAVPEPVDPVRQSSPPAAKSKFEIVDEVMFETISAKYATFDVPLDKPTFDQLVNHICSDMRQGGAGYFTSGDVSALSESGKQSLARSTWLVMATSCYPKDFRWSETDLEDTADFLAALAPEIERRFEAAGLNSSSSSLEPSGLESVGSGSTGYPPGSGAAGGGTGSDVSDSYGSAGSGYTVQCNDGSFSSSGGKRGACSWHGGVSR